MKIQSLNRTNYTGIKSNVKSAGEKEIKDEITLGSTTETPDFLKGMENLKAGEKEALGILGIGVMFGGGLYAAMQGSPVGIAAAVFGGLALVAMARD